MRTGKRAYVQSVSLDFGSINAGASVELTAPLSGVNRGGTVLVSAPSLESGLLASGRVSNMDEVAIRIVNVTAGAIDPAYQQFDIAVIQ